MRNVLKSAVRQARLQWAGRGLSPAARAVYRDRLTYLSPVKLARLERSLAQVIANRAAGDILEFGVALGGTAIVLTRHMIDADAISPGRVQAQLTRPDARRFHGFDVFSMIPPPTSEKDDLKSRKRYDVIRGGRAGGIGGDEYYGYREDLFEEVKANFARHCCPVNGSTVQLHKGLFEETWPTASVAAVAFAHLDCDWYDPVAFCLGAIGNLMSPGGAIVVDDYNGYGGARVAVDEFLKARDDFTFQAGANPILWKQHRA